MRKAPAIILVASTSAYAGYGGMGGPSEGGNTGGGDFSLGAILLVVAFFGGLFWFLSRFKNDQQGFFWLVGGVLILLVISGFSKCSG